MFTREFLSELIERAGRDRADGAHSCGFVLQFLYTADAVRNHLRRSLAEHGGTECGFKVLTTLRADGGGPLPPSEIAERCGMFRGALTDVLARLEASGFVKRHRNESDRRQVLAELTPRGRRQCEQIIDHYLRAILDLAAAVRPPTRPLLNDALTEMIRRADRTPPSLISHER